MFINADPEFRNNWQWKMVFSLWPSNKTLVFWMVNKKSPRKDEFQLDKSKGKVFLLLQRFNSSELISEGQTVNQTFYIEILRPLQDTIRRKRPEICCNYIYLAMLSVTVLEHKPYSLDLGPADFFLFLLKTWLMGKRFSNAEVV